MYTKDDESYFIVDAHVALWDARPENQRNIHGKQFIDCFYDYHRNLSPASEAWPYEEYLYQGGERLMRDLFRDGYVDHAIFQPARLGEFYHRGFGQTEEAFALAQAHPEQLTYNHYFDPRDGERGLDQLRADAERFGLKGVKLYTADWHGDSRGYKLSDPACYRYLEVCRDLGIKNIHVHKGPTIRPLDRDAFDVADVDHAATDFTDLNFIVEHCGLPRLEDFCWIATQEPNVYAGLAVAIPFMHTRPRYFAQIIGELLYWLDENRIFFSSDYALWTPKWLIETFVDFQIPEDMTEYAPLTTDQKKKILGLNAAAMYGIPVPEHLQVANPPALAEPQGRGGGLMAVASIAQPSVLQEEVTAALSSVMDPELDEPITDLGFVRSVEVDDGAVVVHLRLPTSFCSPNFAYLMASDAKDAVGSLPWVRGCVVQLDDHHDSAIINRGLAADAGYRGTFGHEAEENLDELRLTFQRKAHTAAMERCLTALLRSRPDLAETDLGATVLEDLPDDRFTAALRQRRTTLGLSVEPEARVLVDDSGQPHPPAEVPLRLRRARATRISVDGNAHFCRGLLRTRYPDSDLAQAPRFDGAEAADGVRLIPLTPVTEARR